MFWSFLDNLLDNFSTKDFSDNYSYDFSDNFVQDFLDGQFLEWVLRVFGPFLGRIVGPFIGLKLSEHHFNQMIGTVYKAISENDSW